MKTPPDPTPDPLVSVTVLITPTRIGDFNCGAGAQLRIPKSDAETLASLDPPRVRIDGI